MGNSQSRVQMMSVGLPGVVCGSGLADLAALLERTPLSREETLWYLSPGHIQTWKAERTEEEALVSLRSATMTGWPALG